MKCLSLVVLSVVFSSGFAMADVNPVNPAPAQPAAQLVKVDSKSATLQINMGPDGDGQAATLVSGAELGDFLKLMEADKASLISRILARITRANHLNAPSCKTEDCGSIDITSATPVQIAWGRGGWADAAQTSRIFIGFTNPGSGSFTSVSYELDIQESVDAAGDGMDQTKFVKTYTIIGARNITKDKLNLH